VKGEIPNMSIYQANWAGCIIPILIVYGIWSIGRGWNILKHNQPSLDFTHGVNSMLTRIFRGEEKSSEYEDKVLANTDKMKESGWYSLFGGIVMLLVSAFWIFLLTKQF